MISSSLLKILMPGFIIFNIVNKTGVEFLFNQANVWSLLVPLVLLVAPAVLSAVVTDCPCLCTGQCVWRFIYGSKLMSFSSKDSSALIFLPPRYLKGTNNLGPPPFGFRALLLFKACHAKLCSSPCKRRFVSGSVLLFMSSPLGLLPVLSPHSLVVVNF